MVTFGIAWATHNMMVFVFDALSSGHSNQHEHHFLKIGVSLGVLAGPVVSWLYGGMLHKGIKDYILYSSTFSLILSRVWHVVFVSRKSWDSKYNTGVDNGKNPNELHSTQTRAQNDLL